MEEYETLSDSEKATAIRSKIKNLQYQRYSIELELISENAVPNPSSGQVSEFTQQIQNIDLRQAALESELAKLNV